MRDDLVHVAIGIGSTLLLLSFWLTVRWVVNRWRSTRAPVLRLMMLEKWVKDIDKRVHRAEKHLQTIEPDWDDSKALTELFNEQSRKGYELVPRKGPNRR